MTTSTQPLCFCGHILLNHAPGNPRGRCHGELEPGVACGCLSFSARDGEAVVETPRTLIVEADSGRPSYEDFLRAKACAAKPVGITVEPGITNPLLKPFTADIAIWAVRGGCRALFPDFGLHKTCDQLEIMRLLAPHVSKLRLIAMPLEVRHEFFRDAAEFFKDDFALKLKFIRSQEEIDDERTIYLTNYETLREGKLDASLFDAASFDEAAVLRDRGTKTFWELKCAFENTPYKFVATATPSPQEYLEMLSYAWFLGVMDFGQAKTRFFKRNSEKSDNLTLRPNKEEEFWLWVSTWAIILQEPADLGYSNDGYKLPPLDIRWHELPTDHARAGAERSGQGRLIRNAALGVNDASREKRESLSARMAKLMQLRDEDHAAHRIIWHDLEAERAALEDALPNARYDKWLEFKDGNSNALELYERHYSARRYADGRERALLLGPGQKTVLLTEQSDALFAWRKFVDDSGQKGINCAVFRNEGPQLSSDLIKEAMAIAWLRWPGERLYTYVDREEVASSNPGYCFIAAGWTKCGTTKNGKLIFEALPGCPVPDLERRVACASVYGSQDRDERAQAIIDFSEGRIQELAAKPIIAGSGCNFQRHCSWAIFLGIGFKFKDFIQAVHRLRRYGQPRQVRLDLIYTEAEREVRASLEQHWADHDAMRRRMGEIIRKYGLTQNALHSELQRSLGVERAEIAGERFTAVHNDCVIESQRMPADSVHLVLTSVPFATQYEYTPSYNDFGHTDSNQHFFEQMDYLTPELLRILQPGRACIVHVKDRVVDGAMTGFGFQTVYRFSDACADHFERHGFAFVGRKHIITDVVRENAQTYRLGWSEQCKDGSRMGAGLPEHLLIFRKPPTDRSNGYADVPVVKSKQEYSRGRWQFDAHGFERSSGNRLLQPGDLQGLRFDQIFKRFREHSGTNVYDFEHDVALADWLDARGSLPPDFMLLQPHSWHPDVWTDVARMISLNSAQSAAGREKHLCPLPFDICDRVIAQFTMPGELIFDPFAGIGTVPLRALKLGRRGYGVELNPAYFADAARYLQIEEQKRATPSLFEALASESDISDVPVQLASGSLAEAQP